VRKTLLPVGRNQLTFDQGINVVSQRQRHDISLQTVAHAHRLLAGTAMRLTNTHALPGLALPVLVERRVEVFVKLAGRVVGDVEQRCLSKAVPNVNAAVNAAKRANLRMKVSSQNE
jgi:hypothetical protein